MLGTKLGERFTYGERYGNVYAIAVAELVCTSPRKISKPRGLREKRIRVQ